MRRILAILAVAVGLQLSLGCKCDVVTGGCDCCNHPDDRGYAPPTDPRTPAEERRGFRLPPGFEAQLVASEPDIGKPINLAFDAKGRLWVTTSREYPFPAQGRPGRDVLAVLDRIGPDGKAGRITK